MGGERARETANMPGRREDSPGSLARLTHFSFWPLVTHPSFTYIITMPILQKETAVLQGCGPWGKLKQLCCVQSPNVS